MILGSFFYVAYYQVCKVGDVREYMDVVVLNKIPKSGNKCRPSVSSDPLKNS